MKIRVKFSKHGILKYIGHLDLMRYFQKAFRRTDIVVEYSKGFSPHMIMSFAQALGVGVESDGEYFDLEIKDGQDVSLMTDKLNAVMAEGIVITKIVVLPEHAKNAMASVYSADYDIIFEDKNPFSQNTLKKFKNSEDLTYTKTTKTGEHPFNLKEFIYQFSYDDKKLSFECNASSASNIKPKFVIETLCKMDSLEYESVKYHINRNELYYLSDGGERLPLYEA